MTSLGEGLSSSRTLDAVVSTIRDDVVREVKADLGSAVIDRIGKVLASYLGNLPTPTLDVRPQITVLPADVHETPNQVFVTNDLDLSELKSALDSNTTAMKDLCMCLMATVYREVERDSEGNIVRMTEKRGG